MKTMTKIRHRNAGFTLIELIFGMAISSLTLGGVAVASITLQRSFEAANYQMTSQNDQLRVLDYLARDLRMASAVTVLNDGTKVSVVLPMDPAATLTLNLGPLLAPVLGTAPAASTTQTVSYYTEGGQFIRDVGGVQTVLADTVDDIQFTRDGSYLTTAVLFTPRFSNSPTTADQEATRASNRIFLRNASPAS